MVDNFSVIEQEPPSTDDHVYDVYGLIKFV